MLDQNLRITVVSAHNCVKISTTLAKIPQGPVLRGSVALLTPLLLTEILAVRKKAIINLHKNCGTGTSPFRIMFDADEVKDNGMAYLKKQMN
ncbi:MAG TPA: hypothetical protein VFZ52_10460 [Chryseolinea sp.]